jgi:hypothetical protein
MEDISTNLYLETISDNGAKILSTTISKSIQIHHIKGLNNRIIHFQANYDTLDPEYAAQCLEQLGLLNLLPFLVPDHPAANMALNLDPPK